MKTSVPLTRKATWPAAWPGVEIASISRPPVLSVSPSAIVSRDLVLDFGQGLGVGHHRHAAELLLRRGQAGDVVAVGVGDQDVGDLDPVLLGPLEQRPEVVVAVDQHPLATGFVGDEVGVGQPLRVLGPLDDHSRLLPVARACGNSPRRLRPGDRDCAALEQGPGDQPRVIPGRRVADGGQGEEASAGRAALGPRRADQAVELAPGEGHRDLRVAGRVEDMGAHRPVGAVVAARRRSSRAPACARPRRGCARDGRRRWRACARAAAVVQGERRRAGAAAAPRAGVDPALADRRPPEAGR